MTRTRYILLVLLIASGAASPARSQQTQLGTPVTGTPPFASFSGGSVDIVNLANLNAHFTMAVFSKAGRGAPFYYNLQYDSLIWYPVGSSGSQTWTPVYNWGLVAQTAVTTGRIISEYYPYDCYTYIYLNHRWVLTGHRDTYYWDFYVGSCPAFS